MIGSPKAALPKAVPPAVETGMRRNCWVRVTVGEQGAHCDLLGVGHRLPMARRISLDTALALAARGVPLVVRSPAGAAERLQATG